MYDATQTKIEEEKIANKNKIDLFIKAMEKGGPKNQEEALRILSDTTIFTKAVINAIYYNNNKKFTLRLTPLMIAAMNGQDKVCEELLNRGADITAKYEGTKKTALHFAARYNHLNVIKILLNNHADIEAKDGEKETALHITIRNMNKETTTLLLNHGAKTDPKNRYNLTPVALAENKNNKNKQEFLTWLKTTINEIKNKRVLITATKQTTIENEENSRTESEIEEIETANPVVQQTNGITTIITPQNKIDLFIKAMEKGWKNQEEALRIFNDTTEPVIHDLYNNNEQELTFLMIAARNGQDKVCKELLTRGEANVRAKHKGTQKTALHFAATYNHSKASEILLIHKADPNAKDSGQDTPLHKSVKNMDKETIILLLNHGAKTNIQNGQGLTPIQIAEKRKPKDTANNKFLMWFRTKINETQKEDTTEQNDSVQLYATIKKHSNNTLISSSTNQANIPLQQRPYSPTLYLPLPIIPIPIRPASNQTNITSIHNQLPTLYISNTTQITASGSIKRKNDNGVENPTKKPRNTGEFSLDNNSPNTITPML